MMAELRTIKAAVRPTDTLLVVDAMTGQEAASLVKAFNDEVDISGGVGGSHLGWTSQVGGGGSHLEEGKAHDEWIFPSTTSQQKQCC